MRLFIIRHAESLANVQGKMMSSADLPLTEKGIRQSEATRKYLEDNIAPYVFHKIYSSPLLRAKQTAEIICRGHGDIKVSAELREMDLGLLEGLSWNKRATRYPHIDIDNNLSHVEFPCGESFYDIQSRCNYFINSLELSSNYNVLIVSHGITIRILVNCLLEKEDYCVNYINWTDNTAITEINILTPYTREIVHLGYREHLLKLGLGTTDYEKWGMFSLKDYNMI